ncbi:MAG TPA: hypothetical protein VKU38_15910 [Ktedonobacteraceae bacterium]|nr:hypothetical protein [Ktedonobacteraceae bacterium]
MKDDEYFGFSTNDDFKVVNLPDDDSEDDFKIVDLVDFDSEDDIRIVSLSDVGAFHAITTEQDRELSWIDHIDRKKRRKPSFVSSSALKPRCTRKQRVVKSAIVAVLVVTVLLVFLGNAPWNSSKDTLSHTASISQSVPLAPIIAPPVHAAPLIIDANHYYIQLKSSWTQILLDGHSLRNVPIPGVDPPLQISAGHHSVMWRTSNHQLFSCTMSVPPSLTDTCAYNGPELLQSGDSVWIITFPHFNDGD